MPIASCTRAAVAALTFLILASPAAASQSSVVSPPSVRADTPDVRDAIADGAAGSAAFRSLIDRIDQSDLIVYVRCQAFNEPELRGRLTFLSAAGGRRYAVIEVACVLQTRVSLMGLLAHELQHAAEIASAPWVVNADTLDRFYAARGRLVSNTARSRTYETQAAVESARLVQRELREGDKVRATRTADY